MARSGCYAVIGRADGRRYTQTPLGIDTSLLRFDLRNSRRVRSEPPRIRHVRLTGDFAGRQCAYSIRPVPPTDRIALPIAWLYHLPTRRCADDPVIDVKRFPPGS